MRVLIVKTSSMGDVLHTLPSLTDAMRAIPAFVLTGWWKRASRRSLRHEAVDRVIPVAIRRWRKAWFSTPFKAERKAFRDAVQAQRYDAIIDAQGLVKSAALVTRGTRCKARHGLANRPRTTRQPVL